MKLSIVIPMFNAEDFITRCLDSIEGQQLNKKEYEVIIIDDGSEDNSKKIVSNYVKNRYNFTFSTQENKGLSFTRNRGISLAKGDYVYFLDADDYLADHTLEPLLNLCLNYNLDLLEFSFTSTNTNNLKKSKNLDDINFEEIEILNGRDYIASRKFYDYVWLYFINRQFLLETGVTFIEGRIKTDTLFTIQLISRANKITYFPLDVCRYYFNANSVSNDPSKKAFDRAIQDHIYILSEYSKFKSNLNSQHFNTIILGQKQREIAYKICKKLLDSKYSWSEILIILKELEKDGLYPLNDFNLSSYKKVINFFIKNQFHFKYTFKIYRGFLRKPIELLFLR